MKFAIKNTHRENTITLMRRVGYRFVNSSFIRSLVRGGYPRFHIYIKEGQDKLVFNLHLDQKRSIYRGATAHSGDYDGPAIEQEAQRVKQVLIKRI